MCIFLFNKQKMDEKEKKFKLSEEIDNYFKKYNDYKEQKKNKCEKSNKLTKKKGIKRKADIEIYIR